MGYFKLGWEVGKKLLKQPYAIINKVEPKLDLKDTKKYLKKLKKKRKGEKYGK
jgi:hypothetical protein